MCTKNDLQIRFDLLLELSYFRLQLTVLFLRFTLPFQKYERFDSILPHLAQQLGFVLLQPFVLVDHLHEVLAAPPLLLRAERGVLSDRLGKACDRFLELLVNLIIRLVVRIR